MKRSKGLSAPKGVDPTIKRIVQQDIAETKII